MGCFRNKEGFLTPAASFIKMDKLRNFLNAFLPLRQLANIKCETYDKGENAEAKPSLPESNILCVSS